MRSASGQRFSANALENLRVRKLAEKYAAGRRAISGKMGSDADARRDNMFCFRARDEQRSIMIEYRE